MHSLFHSQIPHTGKLDISELVNQASSSVSIISLIQGDGGGNRKEEKGKSKKSKTQEGNEWKEEGGERKEKVKSACVRDLTAKDEGGGGRGKGE